MPFTYKILRRKWKVKKPLYFLLVPELAGTIGMLVLFGLQQPGSKHDHGLGIADRVQVDVDRWSVRGQVREADPAVLRLDARTNGVRGSSPRVGSPLWLNLPDVRPDYGSDSESGTVTEGA